MSTQLETSYCTHCKSKLHGKFCSECGQPRTLKRIDKKHILNEIGNLINFKQGFLYTVKALIISPGPTVQQFILKDRRKLVKPIPFVIFCILMHTVIVNLIDIEWNTQLINDISSINHTQGFFSKSASKILILLTEHLNLLILGSGFFMTLVLKKLFKRYDYNFYELLTFTYYVLGITILINIVLFIVSWIFQQPYIEHISTLIEVSYIGWAVAQFFNSRKELNYLKGIISFILGISLTFISIILFIIIYAITFR